MSKKITEKSRKMNFTEVEDKEGLMHFNKSIK